MNNLQIALRWAIQFHNAMRSAPTTTESTAMDDSHSNILLGLAKLFNSPYYPSERWIFDNRAATIAYEEFIAKFQVDTPEAFDAWLSSAFEQALDKASKAYKYRTGAQTTALPHDLNDLFS